VNSRAPHHAELSRLVQQPDVLLVTTTYVLAELAALLLARSGHALAAEVGTAIRSTPGIQLDHPDLVEESRAWRLFLDRPDKTYSLTDCLSFVTMRRLARTRPWPRTGTSGRKGSPFFPSSPRATDLEKREGRPGRRPRGERRAWMGNSLDSRYRHQESPPLAHFFFLGVRMLR
jgi:predicted nucleic acid-binding protein